MKLTRTREHVINLGNYESFRTSASVEDTVTPELFDESITKADKLLDQALKNDLLEAAELSDVKNTYVLTWNEKRYR